MKMPYLSVRPMSKIDTNCHSWGGEGDINLAFCVCKRLHFPILHYCAVWEDLVISVGIPGVGGGRREALWFCLLLSVWPSNSY